MGAKVRFSPDAPRISSRVCSLHELTIDQIPVVCEYADVFPDELPGHPPDREVEFSIELVPGIAPIAKRPYRMSADELALLK